MQIMTVEEFQAKGKELFGDKGADWKFICPRCKTEQSWGDLVELGMTPEEAEKYVAFSCIGRFEGSKKGCDWTLGGLLPIHRLEVVTPDGKHHPRFEFAPKPAK